MCAAGSGNRNAKGKSLPPEESVFGRLKQMTKSDPKAYYILWRYAPEFLPDKTVKTFEQLKAKYKCLQSETYTKEFCESWFIEKNVQNAIKYLLGRLNTLRMIELYQTFYEKAQSGDIKAFEALVRFASSFFVDNESDNLSRVLRGISLEDEDKGDNEDNE